MNNILKNLSLLGSTGSVGRQVLKLVQQFGDQFRIDRPFGREEHATAERANPEF